MGLKKQHKTHYQEEEDEEEKEMEFVVPRSRKKKMWDWNNVACLYGF